MQGFAPAHTGGRPDKAHYNGRHPAAPLVHEGLTGWSSADERPASRAAAAHDGSGRLLSKGLAAESSSSCRLSSASTPSLFPGCFLLFICGLPCLLAASSYQHRSDGPLFCFESGANLCPEEGALILFCASPGAVLASDCAAFAQQTILCTGQPTLSCVYKQNFRFESVRWIACTFLRVFGMGKRISPKGSVWRSCKFGVFRS